MDMCNAGKSSAFTLADNIHTGTIAAGLWGSCDSVGLPYAGRFGGRDLSPSTTAQTIRDRQVLEQLLTAANITDGSRVAEELLQDYGSLSSALAASSDLADHSPVFGLLSLVQETLVESARSRMTRRKCLTKATDVIEYLVTAMVHLPVEEVRVLFLDTKNCLIRDEAVSRGSVSEAPIYPREILKRALALSATGLILAHNHPSGDPEPSDSDVLATQRLAATGKEIGISLHDHIVVGRAGWVSLRDREQI